MTYFVKGIWVTQCTRSCTLVHKIHVTKIGCKVMHVSCISNFHNKHGRQHADTAPLKLRPNGAIQICYYYYYYHYYYYY